MTRRPAAPRQALEALIFAWHQQRRTDLPIRRLVDPDMDPAPWLEALMACANDGLLSQDVLIHMMDETIEITCRARIRQDPGSRWTLRHDLFERLGFGWLTRLLEIQPEEYARRVTRGEREWARQPDPVMELPPDRWGRDHPRVIFPLTAIERLLRDDPPGLELDFKMLNRLRLHPDLEGWCVALRHLLAEGGISEGEWAVVMYLIFIQFDGTFAAQDDVLRELQEAYARGTANVGPDGRPDKATEAFIHENSCQYFDRRAVVVGPILRRCGCDRQAALLDEGPDAWDKRVDQGNAEWGRRTRSGGNSSVS